MMSDLPEVSEDKLRLVHVVGWGYMLVGLTFIAIRIASLVGMIGRFADSRVGMGQEKVVWLVVMLVMAAFSMGMGGLLIGGGLYLRKRLENARITLIVTSWVLIALCLLRALQTIPMLVILSSLSRTSAHTGSLANGMYQQFARVGIGLLLAIALGILLALVTGPAVKDAMLPKETTAVAPPPPVTQAMQ